MKREKRILYTFCLLLSCLISGVADAQPTNNNNSIKGDSNNSIQGDNNTICYGCTIQNPGASPPTPVPSPRQQGQLNPFTIEQETVSQQGVTSSAKPQEPRTFPGSSHFKVKQD